MKNLYEILEISRNATPDEIKKSYKKLAKKYHPDSNKNDEKLSKLFIQINEAYKILGDEKLKKRYDLDINNEQDSKKDETKSNNQNVINNKQNNIDFENMNKTFEQFFGFDPKTKEVKNESKLKNTKNPIDTTDIFEKFMNMR